MTRTIGAIAGLLRIAACSVFGGAAAPEPEYDAILSEPAFELRDYGELVVAKAPMADGSSAAFGRLFDYISVANSGACAIAMTAPALNTVSADGAKIAMTSPVLQGREGALEMIFVLPEGLTPQTAPVPIPQRSRLTQGASLRARARSNRRFRGASGSA